MQNTIFVRRVEVKEEDDRLPGLEVASDNRRCSDGLETSTALPLLTSTASSSSSTAASSTDKSVDAIEHELPSPPRKEAPKPERTRPVVLNGTYTFYNNRTDANTTRLTITHLWHYTKYHVSVKACRNGTGETCSEDVTLQPRTLKRLDADHVRNLRAVLMSGGTNYTTGSVQLAWDLPTLVNDMILSYTIRYRRLDAEILRGQDMCLSHTLLKNYTGEYTLKGLENGNYSFAVMAMSLAGNGNWSEPVYLYVDVSISTQWMLCGT